MLVREFNDVTMPKLVPCQNEPSVFTSRGWTQRLICLRLGRTQELNALHYCRSCTRVVPKVMSLLHANWEQQTKETAVVDGTSCCVILECLVTSIACITWLVSLLTKWPTTICRFARVLSSNSLWKRKPLLQKFTRDFSVLMEVCAWVRAVFEDGWNILKMGKRRKFRKQCVSVFGWLERSSTAGEFSNFQNAGRNVYKEVAIMWENQERYVD